MRVGRTHRADDLPSGLETGKQIQKKSPLPRAEASHRWEKLTAGTNCWGLSVDNESYKLQELQPGGMPAPVFS